MSAANHLHNEKQSISTSSSDDIPLPNPFAPTGRQIALLAISLMLLIERCSSEHVFPFEISKIWGIIPPECLIWSFLILEMAVKDIAMIYGGIRGDAVRQ